jgi:glycerol-3-phosphate dehydrogenase
VHKEAHAYILQNADKRIVFVIPYEARYSLIGTTDVQVEVFEHPTISPDETTYLIDLANAYLARPLAPADVVWSFSGTRPLYDDGASDPSAITRDYVLKLDRAPGLGEGRSDAPVLSIFGGKLTTYRKLAEHALSELRPYFPQMGPSWTETQPLPGGDLPAGGLAAWDAELARRFPDVDAEVLHGIARRHGSLATSVLGAVKRRDDLGEQFGHGLTAVEIDYFMRDEWARAADDVLWRRSKCGLAMPLADRERVAAYMAKIRAGAAGLSRGKPLPP